MKQLIAILLLCLLLFTACGGDTDSTDEKQTIPATEESTTQSVPPTETAPVQEPVQEPVEPAEVQMREEIVQVFSKYLDAENIVPGLSQRQMKDQMARYSYEGEPFDVDAGIFYDGKGGGGYFTVNQEFGFSNDYNKNLETNYVNYTNEFHTRLPLEGLSMPFDMAFQDEMGQVLEKLELDFDPVESFAQRTDGVKELSLYQSDRESVVITDCRELERSQAAFIITYTETYIDEKLRDNPVTVTREVALSFACETFLLNRIRLKVNEYYLSN